MRQFLSFFSVLMTTLLVLGGCAKADSQASDPFERWMESDKLRILCTTSMIEDIVKQIGQEHVDTLTLIHRELDPHSYELVKGDTEKLESAAIIFANGLGLEHGASLRTYLAQTDRVVAVGDHILKEHPGKVIYVDGIADPHIWTDVHLWSRIITPILETLSKKLPEHRVLFEERAKSVKEQMRVADQEILALLQAIPDNRRYLVTSHDAFNYFTRRYLADPDETTPEMWDKRFEAPEGLSPESQLSALDIKRIVEHLVSYRITVLFPESNVSQDSIRKIVDAGKKHGLKVYIAQTPLYADSMGEPGSSGDTYIGMLKHNAQTIAEHLKIYSEQSVEDNQESKEDDGRL